VRLIIELVIDGQLLQLPSRKPRNPAMALFLYSIPIIILAANFLLSLASLGSIHGFPHLMVVAGAIVTGEKRFDVKEEE